jgi:hypothetical protein
VSAAHRRWRRIAAPISIALVPVLWAAGPASPAAAANTSSKPSAPTGSAHSRALPRQKTSPAQDERFFTDVAEADPALATYEQKQETLALRALLTDGTAFCELLQRAGGIDQALVAEADGVRSTESETSLPLSVTTFNTIEAVALLALCPNEQRRLPASDRSRIRRLGDTLVKAPG